MAAIRAFSLMLFLIRSIRLGYSSSLFGRAHACSCVCLCLCVYVWTVKKEKKEEGDQKRERNRETLRKKQMSTQSVAFGLASQWRTCGVISTA